MKRNMIRRIIIHNAAGVGTLSDNINMFYISALERRLNRLPLTTEQKIAVIDKIIKNLKSREIDGFIE